jgi:GAF domain-containing protein
MRLRMEPLPEVRAAFDQLAELLASPVDLPEQLDAVARVAKGLVPSVVGVSLTVVVDDQPFTMTATDADAGLMDAGQYLDADGPCLQAIDTGRQVTVADVLDEDVWQSFQQSGAAVGVRSSLSLPLRDDQGAVTGALNVYGGEPHAFDEVRDIFAQVFGAQVNEIVMNADLSFRTRDWARELPDRLRNRATVETAVGVLVETRGWPPEKARTRLVDAAEKAGIELERVADIVLRLAS